MTSAIFKQIFLPFHVKLYRIAYRIMENQEDAEDILQDTYAKLWEKRKALAEIDNYEGFAVTVLKNTCLDFLKKKKIYFVQAEEAALSEVQSFSQQFETKNTIEILMHSIKTMPEQQKQVFQLFYRDQYSIEEIEDLTGLKSGNIKVILSRMRKLLNQNYQKIEL